MYAIDNINPDRITKSRVLRLRLHLSAIHCNFMNKRYSGIVFNIKGILREFKPKKNKTKREGK